MFVEQIIFVWWCIACKPMNHDCNGAVRPQASAADIEPHLARVKDATLRHLLSSGVAFLHATMTAAEQEVVTLLFKSGAIQVRLQALLIHLLGASKGNTWPNTGCLMLP